MKTVCVFHGIDLDGWMSAAIVKHWFKLEARKYKYAMKGQTITEPDTIDFIGYNYGQSIPDLLEYDKVIICDISFPKEDISTLENKLRENFIWIDHYTLAIKNSKALAIKNSKALGYDGYKGIRDINFAVCELTWQYFFPNETIPEIVRLLGLYDSFRYKLNRQEQLRLDLLSTIDRYYINDNALIEFDRLSKKKDEEQKVLEFQYGARYFISNYEDAYTYLTKNNGEATIIDITLTGKYIYNYLCQEAKQSYNNGFEIKFDNGEKLELKTSFSNIKTLLVDYVGYKFICINKERFNPISFGIDYHKDGYDGCACFHRAKEGKWSFSLYSDNGQVDCSIIAKQYGGGGHFSASGFVCNTETFIRIING